MPTPVGTDPQSMISTNDTIWPVFTPDPINRNHRLNDGRVMWLLAVPPLDGGSTYWDLCSQYPGTLSSMTNAANNGWRPPQRSNGFSTLQFDGTAAQVTTGYAGLSGATQFTMAVWGRRLNTSTIGVILQAGSAGSAMCGLQHFSDGRIFFLAGNNTTGASTVTVNDAAWHRIVFVYDGTQATAANRGVGYVDGKNSGAVFGVSTPASIPTLATNFVIGRDITDTRWASGYADDIAIWNRPLTPNEVWADYELSLLGYPGVLNRVRPTPTFFISSGVIGSGAITLGALAVAGVGSFKSTATGAITLGPLTVAATGTFADVGTGAITLGSMTVAGAGTVGQIGSGAITLGALSPAGTGSFTVTGSGSVVLAGLSVSGVGTLGQVGAGAITLGALGVSGAGTAANVATGAITLGSVIVVGAGTTSGGASNYDVVTAIQQWFLGQPALQALFSDGQANHLSAAEETLLPYLTYFKTSDVVTTFTTAGKLRTANVQFNVHHQTDAQAQALAEIFSNAIDTIAAGAVVPIVVYGRNALHSLAGDFGIEVGEGLAPDGHDCWICHFSIDIPYTK